MMAVEGMWEIGFQNCSAPYFLGWKHGNEEAPNHPGCIMSQEQHMEYKDGYDDGFDDRYRRNSK